MKNRMAALLTCGFMSFFVLGAAGAASDMYFETGDFLGVHDVACDEDPMESEYSVMGSAECSAHRVSTTYHRQKMAMSLYQDRLHED